MVASDINILFCKSCNETKKNLKWIEEWNNAGAPVNISEQAKKYFVGFIGLMDANKLENTSICPYCKGALIDTGMSTLDYKDILVATDYDRDVLDAMLKLKKSDPIEYRLKLQQLKNAKEQEEQIKEFKQNKSMGNQPHCPTCGSTEIGRLVGFAQDGDLILGGTRRFFHCNNCGYEW